MRVLQLPNSTLECLRVSVYVRDQEDNSSPQNKSRTRQEKHESQQQSQKVETEKASRSLLASQVEHPLLSNWLTGTGTQVCH